MIAHDDITRELPAIANHGLLEPFDEPLPVRIIVDDLLPRISLCYRVIDWSDLDPGVWSDLEPRV
jgi:hypothetical protein